MKTKRASRIAFLLCTICICIPVFINRFPFVYSDTGTYIYIGFTNGVSSIRPAMYGFFIRHISMMETFWLVVVAQALITVYFIRLFIKTFFKEISEFFVFLIVAILTATTSIGIYTGMLMPDFATPIILLSVPIVLYAEKLSWKQFTLISTILWFSVASHHSHALILFLIIISAGFRISINRKYYSKSIVKKLGLLSLILIIGYFTIPTQHYFCLLYTSDAADE